MKRVWMLTAAMVGIAVVGGAGATLALFTDTAAPEPAEFVAGTVALDGRRDQGDTVPGPMFYITPDGEGMGGIYATGLWAPGDKHHRVFHVENVGTLEAKIVSLSAELESGNPELAEILDVAIYDGALLTTGGDPVSPAPKLIYEGKLADFIDEGVTLDPPILLEPFDEENFMGGLAEFGILVSFPLDAGNTYQGDSIKVTFSAYAEQARNN